MKYSFLVLFSICFTLTIQAQSFLNSVEKAGDLIKDNNSKLSFEISTASLNFTFKNRTPALIDKIDANYTIWNYVVGISTLKGSKDLFSKGAFNPGANISISAAHYFQDKGPGYNVIRERFNYEVQGIKSVRNISTQNASIELSNNVNHAFSFDITFARAFRYDFVVSLSLSAKRIYNSPGNLQSEQVSRVLSAGNTSDGNQLSILDNEDRYFGNLLDIENKGELGFDMFWNFMKLGVEKEKNPSIALLGSFVTSYSKFSKPYYNFSIGPSLQPPSNTRLIVFATMFEFLKINKDTDWNNFIKNNFRIRLYVGVPFDVFK